jgi:hypothetical protein
LTPARAASPTFVKSTASRTRLLPPSSLNVLCCHEMPESRTAMPMPLPVMPVICATLVVPVVRMAAVPVTLSIVLAARAIRRFGEMLCTSLRAAMTLTLLAGSMAASASTEL